MKKILHLKLKKKWFDLIAEGKKKEEYREPKHYWISRLYNKSYFPRNFDEIHFRNGYRKDSPFMRVEFKGISQAKVEIKELEYSTKITIKPVIVIHLGKILEIKNWR